MEKQGLGHSKAILAKWLKICICLWSIVNQSKEVWWKYMQNMVNYS